MAAGEPKILVMLHSPLLNAAVEQLNNQLYPLYEHYRIVLIAGEEVVRDRTYLAEGERYVAAFVSLDLGNGQTAEQVQQLLTDRLDQPAIFVAIEQTEAGPVLPQTEIDRLVKLACP